MAPPRKISHSWSVGTLVGGSNTAEGGNRTPASHRGHARVSFGDVLLRVWAELRGDCVHLYPSPQAALPLQVTPSLKQCSVALTSSRKGCVVTSLSGREELILYLQSVEEAQQWCHALGDYCKRALSLEGLNLECGSSEEGVVSCEQDQDALQASGDAIKGHGLMKEELLKQMLATKQLLERKQLHRDMKSADAWTVTAREMTNEYQRAQHEAQQAVLRRVVLLRQRKNSTAIKVANLEKCTSENLADQVKALKSRLLTLDSEMEEAERDSEKMLHDLSEQHNQQLEIIKDFGGVEDIDEESTSTSTWSLDTLNRLGPQGSSASLPSLINVHSHRKDKILNFLGGNRKSRPRGRNPLMYFDKKLRINNSSDNLLTSKFRSEETFPRSTSLDSCDGDSERGMDFRKIKQCHKAISGPMEHNEYIESSQTVRTEISKETLDEIEGFKNLIKKYFKEHPHEKIPSYYRSVI